MNVRTYELMVILDPVRTEEQQQETLGRIDEVITKYGGTPEKRDVWGKRRLAYMLNKRREGYYAIIHFKAETTARVLDEVERHCKYADEIVRHLVTVAVTDKSAGNPALDREREERLARQDPRPPRGGRPRRESFDAPAAAPVAAEAEAPAAE